MKRTICPDCRTILKSDVPSCRTCDLSVAWIANHQNFLNALSLAEQDDLKQIEKWDIHLHVVVKSADQQVEYIETFQNVFGTFCVILTSKTSFCIDVFQEHQSVQVEFDGNKKEADLPGEITFDDVEISCRLSAEVRSKGEIPTITTPGQKAPCLLVKDKEMTFGSGDLNDVKCWGEEIDLEHCVAIWDSKTNECWIADTGTKEGTYVNRQQIVSSKLSAGDLVRIGPYAWTFNNEDKILIPALPIDQVEIQINGLQVDNNNSSERLRLDIPQCNISAGQFVAIVGSSGSGKSTFLKALAGLQGSRDRGTIFVDDKNVDLEHIWFRELLGYVPQEKTVHPSLSARSSLKHSAKLRGISRVEIVNSVDRVLREVQLPERCWNTSVKDLSGGEVKRLCTAIELITNPQLLLLDEPGSGLDFEREINLMKLLRNFSLRGCTVVVVTHNIELTHCCDRLISIHDGKVIYDGSPLEFDHLALTTNLPKSETSRTHQKQNEHSFSLSKTTNFLSSQINNFKRKFQSLVAKKPPMDWNQFHLLLQRESEIIYRDFRNRLILPLFIVPAFFAFALGVSIDRQNEELLWFFGILAVIWMGTSLSLLSIVGERKIFNHEQHLFLRIRPYLLAKFLALSTLSVLQTALFIIMLCAVRKMAGGAYLDSSCESHPEGPLFWIFISLCMVSLAAVSVGMLISAISNRSQIRANFILPLVMIAQIVFSYPIYTGTSTNSFIKAYDKFSVQTEATPLRKSAIYISYAMLSRHGDMALRSLAYGNETKANKDDAKKNQTWYWFAILTLFVFIISQISVAGNILYWQTCNDSPEQISCDSNG